MRADAHFRGTLWRARRLIPKPDAHRPRGPVWTVVGRSPIWDRLAGPDARAPSSTGWPAFDVIRGLNDALDHGGPRIPGSGSAARPPGSTRCWNRARG